MSLLAIIVILLAAATLVWAVQAYLPIPQPFKNIVCFLLVVLAVGWILEGTGIMTTPVIGRAPDIRR